MFQQAHQTMNTVQFQNKIVANEKCSIQISEMLQLKQHININIYRMIIQIVHKSFGRWGHDSAKYFYIKYW